MADNKGSFSLVAKNFFDSIGIDAIPYAIGLAKFSTTAPFQPTKLKEIESQVDNLSGKKLDEAISYSKEILNAENDRGDKIENKAYNIIGITGISAAFITGVTSLLTDTSSAPIFFYLILGCYFFIVLSLTFTVLLASRVVTVGEYKFAYPDISDIFEMGSQNLDDTKKERLASYIYCYARNYQIHNIKVSYLISSQIWFRNAIILFLLLALTLTFSISRNSNNVVISPTASPIVALTTTSTVPVTPPQFHITVTPTPVQLQTITPTFMVPTETPLSTIIPSLTVWPLP